MLKLLTVVGTRPEIIRLSKSIPVLDKHFNHKLVHTGQNFDYELNEIFFDDLNIRKPDKFLNVSSKSPTEAIGKIISEVDKVIKRFKPDAFLILGDTNSCLSAISAKRNKVPIFHIEAGNRCFDYRVPEEINRKIVDHLSDINITYSQIAREHLVKENFPSKQVIKLGSPLKEVMNSFDEKISSSVILDELSLEPSKYFLMSFHREENVDKKENLMKIFKIIRTLDKKFNLPIIISTHPRTKNRMKKVDGKFSNNISFLKPFKYSDYVKLQLNSKCVISDSGTITEESSLGGFDALNLRESHERPEGFEEAAVIMTGLDDKIILQALEILKISKRKANDRSRLVSDYDVDNFSNKLLKVILSYTDYVRREVWKA